MVGAPGRRRGGPGLFGDICHEEVSVGVEFREQLILPITGGAQDSGGLKAERAFDGLATCGRRFAAIGGKVELNVGTSAVSSTVMGRW